MLKNTTVKHYPELTAIHRKSISFPSRFLLEKNLLVGKVLDFGAGHGKDVEELTLKRIDIESYDKFYIPEFPKSKYDTIICHYVLNVVDKEEQTRILAEVSYLLKPKGKAYFTVRRDLLKEGIRMHAIHKLPTYQCNVVLPFPSLFKAKHCEIYVYQKPSEENLLMETVSVKVYKSKYGFEILEKRKYAGKAQKAKVILQELLQLRKYM
ncbi:methyltransferase domain-containing protein [Flammeovirga sp. EKP202]|uniref:methyltransferase domain-containing protein n=1 Tax=Flammeovirga sp. EKP202 TaxID=2770592 RepID=UPI00165F72AD|nr:methyltransferase domain-containing protein [Flammeovirga sp. EKP202]MBD0404408.1 methyltransferase domain-containing protein [Flammeovirga sp. EKP202]